MITPLVFMAVCILGCGDSLSTSKPNVPWPDIEGSIQELEFDGLPILECEESHSDAFVPDLNVVRYYRFDGASGQRVTLTLNADPTSSEDPLDRDMILGLWEENEGWIGLNDDCGDGGTLDSCLSEVELPRMATYVVVVTSYGHAPRSTFTLSLTCHGVSNPTTCDGVTCSDHGECVIDDEALEVDLASQCEDTFINSDGLVNRADDPDTIMVYTYPSDTPANRILMHCDVSDIPNDATIESATLSLYMYGFELDGRDPICDIAARPIINVDPVVSACTWSTYNGVDPWTGGADGGSRDMADAEWVTQVGLTTGYYDWEITTAVQEWVSGSEPNYGLMLDADSVAAANTNRGFRPTEHANASQRPHLIVHYRPPSLSTASCLCETGYVADGLECIEDPTTADGDADGD